MDLKQTRAMLATLRHERSVVAERMAQREAAQVEDKQSLDYLNDAVLALEPLLPPEERDDPNQPGSGEPPAGSLPDLTTRTPTPDTDGKRDDAPKRIKSSEAVRALVEELGRPISRADLKEQFKKRGLIPESWAHPDNALNNAITRAADRGLVQRDGDTFSPMNYPMDRSAAGVFSLESEA